jgi:hypothetical protein
MRHLYQERLLLQVGSGATQQSLHIGHTGAVDSAVHYLHAPPSYPCFFDDPGAGLLPHSAWVHALTLKVAHSCRLALSVSVSSAT